MKRLGGTDALFLSMETPSWHQHVAGLTILDPSQRADFGFAETIDVLEQRLPLAPKFKWKLKEVPLGLDLPVWIEDQDFQIERHVRRVGVPAPGGKYETAEMLGEILSHQLDRRRPLWEYWYLEGLKGGRVAHVIKFHHSLLDGVSGASLATVLMDLAPDSPPPTIPDDLETAGPEPSTLELLARSALPNTRLPLRVARYGAALANRGINGLFYQRSAETKLPIGGAPTVRWNGKVGPRRSCAFSSVALEDVKAIKESQNVKVNDVILAIGAGAMRKYLQLHDELPANPLVSSCPVSTRAPGDESLSNKISNMFVSLATDVDDPIRRLQAIAESSRSAKGMAKALQARQIQSLGETAPPLVLNQAIRAISATGALSAIPTVANTIISNVPGPPIPLYFAGAKVTGVFPGSVLLETMGFNLTVISYVDRVDFGLATDPDLIPDLWTMADLIPVALAELLKAAKLGRPHKVTDPWGD